MKRIYAGSFFAIALATYGTSAQAQAPQQPGDDARAAQTERAEQAVSLDETAGPMIVRQATGLAGLEVMSANGDSIGEIDEVVYSNIDGEYYGVLEVSGILGIGDAQRLVALNDLEFDPNEERLYLSSSQDLEEALAEFDPELYSETDNETTVQIRSREDAELE